MTKKTRPGAAHKPEPPGRSSDGLPPFEKWLLEPVDYRRPFFYDVFEAIQLLIEEGCSKEEVFYITRKASNAVTGEPPVSDNEISGIIDLLCLGVP
jgi:hypothetical protein